MDATSDLRSLRQGMAARLAEDLGLSDDVRRAVADVPRHRFAPRFWSLPADVPDAASAELREWTVDDSCTDPEAAALIHHVDRAHALRPGGTTPARVTSTISAPRLVAWTLAELGLTPGMRVLEIGTGSGYNAALLAELVGPTGAVVTVEIDEELARGAKALLAELGYGSVRVVVGDGYFGAPEFGPFDRVVATVGCTDVAPAWLEQLGSDGFSLIPVLHGGLHPTMRVEVDARGARGGVVGYSGFVSVLGHQASADLWQLGPSLSLNGDPVREPMPEVLRKAFSDCEGAPAARRAMDLAYYLALEEHERAFHSGLTDGASLAAVDPSDNTIALWGPSSDSLRDALLAYAEHWIAAGAPAATEYRSTWVARDSEVDSPRGAWMIPRVDHVQIIHLLSSS